MCDASHFEWCEGVSFAVFVGSLNRFRKKAGHIINTFGLFTKRHIFTTYCYVVARL